MRVLAKFAATFIVSSYVVLAGVGYLNARSEARAYRLMATDELDAVGVAAAAAIGTTWDGAGEDAARSVVASLDDQQPDLRLRFSVGPLEPAEAAFGPLAVERAFAVRTQRGTVGHLHLSRRVPGEGDILLAHLGTELLGALSLTLLGGGLAWLIGASVIGRPLQRVVAQVRRIGAGDLTHRLKSSGNDEIGEVKRALNRMCDELEAARARLAEETAVKTETLEQLRHLDRLRTVGTLSSAFAHELGTPMNVLLLRAQQLASPETENPETREAGEAMARQVERMARTVRQMLDFARHERPKLSRTSASSLAHDAVGLVSPLAERAGVSLSVDDDERAVVLADRGHIEQALTNLVVNAIHATPAGGRVILRVRREAEAVPPSTVGIPPRNAVSFAVIDNGTGLLPEELDRVFAPFYSSKPAGTGTGLGLSVAKGIAEDHQGWLTATSTPQVGSAFTLWLPVAPDEGLAAQSGEETLATAWRTVSTST